jgi:hypothetical protein
VSIHPKSCACAGTGFISAPRLVHKNEATYDKVSIRCPGETPKAPADAPAPIVDQKRKAAGEVEGS